MSDQPNAIPAPTIVYVLRKLDHIDGQVGQVRADLNKHEGRHRDAQKARQIRQEIEDNRWKVLRAVGAFLVSAIGVALPLVYFLRSG